MIYNNWCVFFFVSFNSMYKKNSVNFSKELAKLAEFALEKRINSKRFPNLKEFICLFIFEKIIIGTEWLDRYPSLPCTGKLCCMYSHHPQHAQ